MSSTSSPFGQNEWLVEEMYRKFRDDPSSVDPSWHEFLVDYIPEPTSSTRTPRTPLTGETAAAPAAEAAPPRRRLRVTAAGTAAPSGNGACAPAPAGQSPHCPAG